MYLWQQHASIETHECAEGCRDSTRLVGVVILMLWLMLISYIILLFKKPLFVFDRRTIQPKSSILSPTSIASVRRGDYGALPRVAQSVRNATKRLLKRQ